MPKQFTRQLEQYKLHSQLMLYPRLVQQGRQKELDNKHRHEVVEEVWLHEAKDGAVVRGKWLDDMRGNIVRSRLVAQQSNCSKREDMTQATPGLKGLCTIVSFAANYGKQDRSPGHVELWHGMAERG
eukprot:6486395-Amphidinium_carterae.3